MKFRPSEVSRDEVQVVLRDQHVDLARLQRGEAILGASAARTSPWSASLKIAAAMARQKSTSSPVQLPCASGEPKPASVPLAPQLSMPRSLTAFSVWAEAPCAAKHERRERECWQSVSSRSPSRMTGCGAVAGSAKHFRRRRVAAARRKCHVPGGCPEPSIGQHLRTIGVPGQGVDACGAMRTYMRVRRLRFRMRR